MEQEIKKIKPVGSYFLRPSLLLGDRSQFRLLERLAIITAPFYSGLLLGSLQKYKPVQATDVAKVMVLIANKKVSCLSVVENKQIHELSQN